MGLRYVILAVWMIWASHQHVHCMNTKTIACKFQGGLCNYTQDTSDDFDWSLENEKTLDSRDPKQNYYICACRNNTILPPRSLARLISPIYEVKGPSLLILQFRHFKTKDDNSLLRIRTQSVSRKIAIRDELPFFRSVDYSINAKLPWTTLEGKANVFSSFQLVIEAQVGFSAKSRVALDDIIINLYSYNSPQAEVTVAPPKRIDSLMSDSSGKLNQTPQRSENGAQTSVSNMTSHVVDKGALQRPTKNVLQEKTEDDEGVSMCFILSVVSSSLLIVFIIVFLFVAFSLSRRKIRYRRFHFGHDYEEIQGKALYNSSKSSVSAMALMRKRTHSRLSYRNLHTNPATRIPSLSSCLMSRMSMRDSLQSSIYAEITEADLELAMDRSDDGVGNSTTMTTTCTGTWDIMTDDGSTSDMTMADDLYVTASSIKLYNSLSNEGSENDSGWVENIIYERTSDIGSLESMKRLFKTDKVFKGLSTNKATAGFETRQRVHTV